MCKYLFLKHLLISMPIVTNTKIYFFFLIQQTFFPFSSTRVQRYAQFFAPIPHPTASYGFLLICTDFYRLGGPSRLLKQRTTYERFFESRRMSGGRRGWKWGNPAGRYRANRLLDLRTHTFTRSRDQGGRCGSARDPSWGRA